MQALLMVVIFMQLMATFFRWTVLQKPHTERALELKAISLGDEKEEAGLKMQEGPPLLTRKWETLA